MQRDMSPLEDWDEDNSEGSGFQTSLIVMAARDERGLDPGYRLTGARAKVIPMRQGSAKIKILAYL